MELIWFVLMLVLSGLVVGGLGRLSIPGPDPMSVPMTILMGVGGSLIGGVVAAVLFGRSGGPGLLFSVGGAALLVWLMRRRRPRAG